MTDDAAYSDPDPESPLLVELLDDEGRIALRHRVPVARFFSHPPVGQLAVGGKVPYPDGTRILRFFRDEILLAQIDVAREGPRVTIEWPLPDSAEGRQHIKWSGEHPEDRELQYIVCFHSSGAGWQALTTTSAETEYEIDLDELLAGGARSGSSQPTVSTPCGRKARRSACHSGPASR
jgi:hypothetical protein